MNDVYSFGNTVINLFSGWSGDNFYHFYIRKQAPRNSIVKEYFNISSTDAVKALLKGKSGGCRFTQAEIDEVQRAWGKAEAAERQIIEGTRKKKKSFVYFLEETFWSTKLWQNRRFKSFVKDADPDVFFAFATNSYILYPLIRYLKKRTRAKIVLFIADDMLTAYSKRGFIRRRNLTRKLRKCIESADKLYGISDKMCEYYSEEFGKKVEFLCKGCDFSLRVRNSESYPLKLVYAGNVLYGRDSTLSELVNSLKEINSNGAKAQLDIYTMTKLQPDTLDKLNVSGTSRVLDGIPYKELLEVENRADILLHVESFEKEAAERVKFSFSTKITDCLQSGAAIAAIGPDGIASIEYLKRVDGVTVITDRTGIKDAMEELTSDTGALNDKKRRTREYAETHLSGAEMNSKLKEEFTELI